MTPRDLGAERAVLGACLVNSNALTAVLSELNPDDFVSENHRGLFAAIRSAARDHDRIDHVVLSPYLPDGMDVRRVLFELVESVPTASNAASYARRIKAASRARQTLEVLDRLRAKCLSDDYANAPETAMAEMEAVLRSDASGDVAPLSDALEDLAAWLAESRSSEGVTGIRTGIPKLDAAVKGLNKKKLYVVAARPGQGKSLLCGQVALTAAQNGFRVLLQSPEMGKAEYLRRLAVSRAGVDATRVQDGLHDEREEREINQAGAEIAQLPLTIDDFGTQPLGRVRRNVVRYKPDLLVVDYLQMLLPDDRRASRYEQVSQLCSDLVRIKKDFDIPVLAAAQLSRAVEQRQDKRPMLSDIRDSGTVEQDADAIVTLFKPSHYDDSEPEDLLRMAVEKNRSGPLYETAQYIDRSLWIVPHRNSIGREIA